MNKWLKALLFLLGAAFLTRLIPFSHWFRILDTMFHELGHAILTLIMSGRVLRIELNPDQSGVTYSILQQGWSQIIVSLAGYITASLCSIAMFFVYYKQRQAAGLIVISALALITIVLFVHSGYGLWWLLIFILLNVLIYFIGERVRNFYFLLLAFLCLEESVVSPIYLLALSIINPSQAGDATNLADITFLPAVVWSLLFVLIACICARLALQLYWKSGSRTSISK
ncbi:M50 family metallopeptidase [Paenibacillus sp. D2_2]|uniref:M50 family metallopeptidase n=1 Tax=Paenibacillus sp. D2_2 TaxID=3073092 RepID=UPI002815774F|nr:M50 family metallopeptidase [Paenibacillus sp. D2_2]WMT43487.1 M50 family metallopeptidase [Paenibacillus sp. D2_2]